MKKWLKSFAPVCLAMSLTAGVAQAQNYPEKPITFLVPYAAGGLTDVLAREVGAHMSKKLGQPVVVDNKPGGAAQVGMNVLKKAPADGYTVFIGDVPSLATNVGLFKNLSYDPRTDLQPVGELIVSPALVVVPMNSPYQTFEDLVKGASEKPQGLTYASQGVGTGGHLFGTLLQNKLNQEMTHVAYKGSIPGLQDTISGQVDFMYDAIPTSGPFVLGDKLRALAIGSKERSPLLPNVPTLEELGYGEIVPTFWWGVAVKKGTPDEIVELLSKSVAEAMHDPQIAGKFTSQGVLINTTTPAEFTAYINEEIEKWSKVMADANMQVN